MKLVCIQSGLHSLFLCQLPPQSRRLHLSVSIDRSEHSCRDPSYSVCYCTPLSVQWHSHTCPHVHMPTTALSHFCPVTYVPAAASLIYLPLNHSIAHAFKHTWLDSSKSINGSFIYNLRSHLLLLSNNRIAFTPKKTPLSLFLLSCICLTLYTCP